MGVEGEVPLLSSPLTSSQERTAMQAFDFIPFEPTFRAFEIAMQGAHAHKKLAYAPEATVRFTIKAEPPSISRLKVEPTAESFPVFSCRYETYSFPEQQRQLRMLRVTGPDTDFYFDPDLELFFTKELVK